jgi:WD40 repeat protein
VFTGCGDGVVRAYDAKSSQLRRVYTGHEGAVNCIQIVRDKGRG